MNKKREKILKLTPEEAKQQVLNKCYTPLSREAKVVGIYEITSKSGNTYYHSGVVIMDPGCEHYSHLPHLLTLAGLRTYGHERNCTMLCSLDENGDKFIPFESPMPLFENDAECEKYNETGRQYLTASVKKIKTAELDEYKKRLASQIEIGKKAATDLEREENRIAMDMLHIEYDEMMKDGLIARYGLLETNN